jgi:hypothetical protein
MTRRGLLFSGLALAQVDELMSALNDFADTYNRFVDLRNKGIHDLKLAAKLSKQWNRVEKCEGWPR